MHSEESREALSELVAIARTIVSGKKEVISDLRQMAYLAHKTSHAEEKAFLAIIGIDCEFDGYPLGSVRDHYEKGFLKQLDDRAEKDLAHYLPYLVKACDEIISKYGTAA